MSLVTYTLIAVDAVTDKKLKVHYPAVTPLMAQAWAELCFRNNAWSSAELHSPTGLVWSDAK